jgi:DNA-directed RNA polymerase subunit RPC12/RpoP
MLTYTCPGCQRSFQLSDDRAGRVAKCQCGHKAIVPDTLSDALAPLSDTREEDALKCDGWPSADNSSDVWSRPESSKQKLAWRATKATAYYSGWTALYALKWLVLALAVICAIVVGVAGGVFVFLMSPVVFFAALFFVVLYFVVQGAVSSAIRKARR